MISSRASLAGGVAVELAGLKDHDPTENRADFDRAVQEAERDYRDLQREREAARTLLTRHWPAVWAVARALLQRGELVADDAERIVIDALDDVTRQRLRSAA